MPSRDKRVKKETQSSNNDWVSEFSRCGPQIFICFCSFTAHTSNYPLPFPSDRSIFLLKVVWFRLLLLPWRGLYSAFSFRTCCPSFLLQVGCGVLLAASVSIERLWNTQISRHYPIPTECVRVGPWAHFNKLSREFLCMVKFPRLSLHSSGVSFFFPTLPKTTAREWCKWYQILKLNSWLPLHCVTSVWGAAPRGMDKEGWLTVTLRENNFSTEMMPLKLFIHNHSFAL